MAYIWDDYSKEKYFRVASSGISPYLEVWDGGKDDVLVNIYIRLCGILFPYGECTEEKLNELLSCYEDDGRYQDIVNAVLHDIVRQDRNRGLTLQDFWAFNTWKEIIFGCYGEETRDSFRMLEREDQFVLCRYIAKYDMSKGREMQLDAAVKALFHDVNIYFEKSSGIIHVCINQDRDEYRDRLFSLVCKFLKDIDIRVEVYWKREHFGIIGVEETMYIGSTALI